MNAVIALHNDDSAKGMEIAAVMGTTMNGNGRAGECGLITLKQLRFNEVVNVPVALWNEEKTAKRYFLPIIPSFKSFGTDVMFLWFCYFLTGGVGGYVTQAEYVIAMEEK